MGERYFEFESTRAQVVNLAAIDFTLSVKLRR